jgi:hypothetical protein
LRSISGERIPHSLPLALDLSNGLGNASINPSVARSFVEDLRTAAKFLFTVELDRFRTATDPDSPFFRKTSRFTSIDLYCWMRSFEIGPRWVTVHQFQKASMAWPYTALVKGWVTEFIVRSRRASKNSAPACGEDSAMSCCRQTITDLQWLSLCLTWAARKWIQQLTGCRKPCRSEIRDLFS